MRRDRSRPPRRYSGLHTVRGKVHAEPRETLLPPDLFQRFGNDTFFRAPQRMPKNLRIV